MTRRKGIFRCYNAQGGGAMLVGLGRNGDVIHKCFETERMCVYNTTLALRLIIIATTHLYKTTRNESGCHVGPVTVAVTSRKPGVSLIAYASLTFVFPFHNLFIQKQKHQTERKTEGEKVRSLVLCYHSAPLCLSVKRARLLWRLVFDHQGQVQI